MRFGWLLRGLIAFMAGALPQVVAAEDLKIDVLEVLSTNQLRVMHGYLGVVADNLSEDLYKLDQVETVMADVVKMCDVLTQNLQGLREGDLTEKEKEFITELISIYQLQQAQARSMISYTTSKNDKYLTGFLENGAQAWTKIQAIVSAVKNKE